MPVTKNIKIIPQTSVRMADAEGTLGGPSCKGKSSWGGACLDRQPQSGDLLIKAAA